LCRSHQTVIEAKRSQIFCHNVPHLASIYGLLALYYTLNETNVQTVQTVGIRSGGLNGLNILNVLNTRSAGRATE
jgi:hypothetical protein